MATQKAYHKGTDTEVQPGEIIKGFRGDDCVSEMTINVNSWEVYDAESVEALKLIAKTVTVPEWTR